jgi:hypothetical protein
VEDRRVPLDVFVGRSAELARMAEVAARVEAGQPWLVAIEGDPGVGKTALARRYLAQAPGLRALSARGGQAENDLDFGLVDPLFRVAVGVSRPALAVLVYRGPSGRLDEAVQRMLLSYGEPAAPAAGRAGP